MSKAQEVHEALKPIAWLAGKWSTKSGKGVYPNITDFAYHEELEFKCIGQPILNYTTVSRHPEKQNPMHLETGFLRLQPGTNKLAFAISHNMGLTSIEEGTVDEEKKVITVESTTVGRMSFGKKPFVTGIKRVIQLKESEEGDELEVEMFMETETTPMTEHLKAVYKRVE